MRFRWPHIHRVNQKCLETSDFFKVYHIYCYSRPKNALLNKGPGTTIHTSMLIPISHAVNLKTGTINKSLRLGACVATYPEGAGHQISTT